MKIQEIEVFANVQMIENEDGTWRVIQRVKSQTMRNDVLVDSEPRIRYDKTFTTQAEAEIQYGKLKNVSFDFDNSDLFEYVKDEVLSNEFSDIFVKVYVCLAHLS